MRAEHAYAIEKEEPANLPVSLCSAVKSRKSAICFPGEELPRSVSGQKRNYAREKFLFWDRASFCLSVCLSVFLSSPYRQGTQSDVAVFGTANVDSKHICLAMEERSLQGVRGVVAGSNIVPFH